MKKVRNASGLGAPQVDEPTPAPSSLTRSSLTRATFGSISGLHRAATTTTTTTTTTTATTTATATAATATSPRPSSSRPPKPYSFTSELRPSDLQIDDVDLPPLHPLSDPDQYQKQPYSFINELRPQDLELSHPHPPPPPPDEDDEVSASDLLPDEDEWERDDGSDQLADPADVHPADDDSDDRTIERYVPPSVRDLDYDTEMTSEVPTEWLDYLAASARPSDRPPPVAPSTMPPPPPAPTQQPVSFFGSFPPGSFPTPSAIVPVPFPPMTPSSSIPIQHQQQQHQQQQHPPRSNPIPWIPTPVEPPTASPLRRGLLFFACVILWGIFVAAALRILIGH